MKSARPSGPLLIALVLFLKGSYQTGYALLAISAVLALPSLTVARIGFPIPSGLEEGRTAPATGFTSTYWLYMLAGAFFGAGLMSFELISYHLSSTGIVADHWIPVFLAFSIACGVVASLVFGRLYDRVGMPVVLVAVPLSSLFSPFVFLGNLVLVALVGMVFWGIGYTTQDTLLKVLIASVLPEGRRNLAFGLFYVGYGVGWLIGSVATGLLYEQSHLALVAFAVVVQLASLAVFAIVHRQGRSPG